MRGGLRKRHGFWLVGVVALGWMVADGTRLEAHRVDELLQSTFISIEPDSVRFDLLLTPGTQIASSWIAEVDGDRDGEVSKEEATAFGGRLAQALTVEIDHRACSLGFLGQQFPSRAEVLDGSAVIRCSFLAQVASFPSGAHVVSYENHYDLSRSVYLVNAVVPSSSSIKVTRQHRDELQREMYLDFQVRAEPVPASSPDSLNGATLTLPHSRSGGVRSTMVLAALTSLAGAGVIWGRRRQIERANG